ncbi:PD40 domain-containing protein [Candidatus Poribacteria bacterium]|nr:PD40 domain-containing protein [Candidatus Poribacteria bacterium]
MKGAVLAILLTLWFISTALCGDLVFTVRKPLNSLQGFKASIGIYSSGVGPSGVSKRWWEFFSQNIYTMNPDGTELRQLTDDNISIFPRWSPDGRYIAYISGPDGNQELWVMRGDGSGKRRLLGKQERINYFWWSPKSDQILVSVKPKRSVDRLEGWVVSVDGKDRKRMGSSEWAKGWNHWNEDGRILNPHPRLIPSLPKDAAWPFWTWDNKYIAFITSGVLALADVEGVIASGRWALGRDEPPCDEIYEWAPDGRRILFSARGYVCTAEVVRGRFKNLINVSNGRAAYATWNGDGTKIAYAARPGDRKSLEIFIVNPDGSNQVRITNTNYDHLYLDWK